MKVGDLKRLKLALTREQMSRKESDALLQFKPHAKQQIFIDAMLDGECQQGWFVAANRSGKSDAGAYIGSTFARFGRRGDRWINCGDGLEVNDKATSEWDRDWETWHQ